MNNAESQTAGRTDVKATHFVSFFHFSLIAEADEVFSLAPHLILLLFPCNLNPLRYFHQSWDHA